MKFFKVFFLTVALTSFVQASDKGKVMSKKDRIKMLKQKKGIEASIKKKKKYLKFKKGIKNEM
jgi:hypothetical protein